MRPPILIFKFGTVIGMDIEPDFKAMVLGPSIDGMGSAIILSTPEGDDHNEIGHRIVFEYDDCGITLIESAPPRYPAATHEEPE